MTLDRAMEHMDRIEGIKSYMDDALGEILINYPGLRHDLWQHLKEIHDNVTLDLHNAIQDFRDQCKLCTGRAMW